MNFALKPIDHSFKCPIYSFKAAEVVPLEEQNVTQKQMDWTKVIGTNYTTKEGALLGLMKRDMITECVYNPTCRRETHCEWKHYILDYLLSSMDGKEFTNAIGYSNVAYAIIIIRCVQYNWNNMIKIKYETIIYVYRLYDYILKLNCTRKWHKRRIFRKCRELLEQDIKIGENIIFYSTESVELKFLKLKNTDYFRSTLLLHFESGDPYFIYCWIAVHL